MARDRYLPVPDEVAGWLPEPGLVRGRVVACTGDAAMSVALTLASRATRAGSWLAVVGAPTLGVDAARELGVELGRLVLVDGDVRRPQEWAERVAAAADGFEVILTCPPAGADRVLRLVRQRLQARGVVLLTVDPPLAASRRSAHGDDQRGADIVIRSTTVEWDGLSDGHGHLRRRRLVVSISGRRAGRPVRHECWLPGRSGRLESLDPPAEPVAEPVTEPDRGVLERAG
jgi:hypothetical protein